MRNKTININTVAEVARGLQELKNRASIVQEIDKAHREIKKYIIDELKIIWEKPKRHEMLSIHIHPLMLEERLPLLMKKINQIVNL